MDNKNVIFTGVVRISYPHLAEAHQFREDSKPQYSACFIIDKEDTKTVNSIKAAIEAAINMGLAKVFNGRRPGKLNMPLKDGDERNDEKGELDQTYVNKYYINASNQSKPEVYDCEANLIEDPEAIKNIKGGDYVIAKMSFRAYSSNSKGIKCDLLGVQFVKEGEHFGTKVSGGGFSAVNPDDLF